MSEPKCLGKVTFRMIAAFQLVPVVVYLNLCTVFFAAPDVVGFMAATQLQLVCTSQLLLKFQVQLRPLHCGRCALTQMTQKPGERVGACLAEVQHQHPDDAVSCLTQMQTRCCGLPACLPQHSFAGCRSPNAVTYVAHPVAQWFTQLCCGGQLAAFPAPRRHDTPGSVTAQMSASFQAASLGCSLATVEWFAGGHVGSGQQT